MKFIPLLVFTIFVLGCLNNGGDKSEKPDPVGCVAHDGCVSGVCNRIQKDSGICALAECADGEKTDNNNFYCQNNVWIKSRGINETCAEDFECFEPTCFMDPLCGTRDKKTASCEDGICIVKTIPTPCGERLTKVLQKDQYTIDEEGNCIESRAQMVLPTICIVCGDDICTDQESICNCPQDCK